MKKRNLKFLFCIVAIILKVNLSYAQDDLQDLELLDDKDLLMLLEEEADQPQQTDVSDEVLEDELKSLKNNQKVNLPGEEVLTEENKKKINENNASGADSIDEIDILAEDVKSDVEVVEPSKANKINTSDKKVSLDKNLFNVGKEEKELLELAKFVEKKIPADEWNELATAAKVDKYVVQEGDWLWKISKNLFGSGFYYSKIWSMNPQITNPHEIEPGQILVFSTGSEESFPKVSFGSFDSQTPEDTKVAGVKVASSGAFSNYGEDIKSDWLVERRKLIDKGAFFQSLTESTYQDVLSMTEIELNTDYKKYAPPVTKVLIEEPTEEYDENGISSIERQEINVSQGFYLNTFLSTNHIQDLGYISDKKDEAVLIHNNGKAYVQFDKSVQVRPGDQFSIYQPQGKVSHEISDREGLRYSIVGQVKATRELEDNKWEVDTFQIVDVIERGARITVYTPKIAKIFQTYNSRRIEAAIIGAFKVQERGLALGDVIYLDRGRVDGVELGNIFEIYSFRDQGTGKKISSQPTYVKGEATIITVTDNFATAVISYSNDEMGLGNIALTKSEATAKMADQLRTSSREKALGEKENLALEELDVELNLDNLGEDLLKQVDEIRIEEDELEELERQEREKSIIKEQARDLKELEKLEQELIDAETKLNEQKIDEDTYLERQDLNLIEKGVKTKDPNALESMNEIEAKEGRKYMDEDLNSKENPYGLTPYDIEEIEELLNSDSN
ncbi:LysM domain protein [Halobacteriovorax sp. BALOs_7]|uniref:LysM peptidoglycan-binding domain-containing protein n=1 Tax=Halobacteriovorax vibrionivorans TaxID=2152716 RepID=A0ABY0IHG9_9BACT|nr:MULTISPECIES: LysM peptidoglycan-binding domain-containing protein [Halobacteriovorax]AYF45295.1 LysM domain protein [Halobacteriovorax sp. BALOs_7]RZF22382.1 LysM peptidoglycan-binding domain-containing protein [Halobacteriovorax vibrionivorans]TGD48634.1 LysM peptidoglycan-binding domain-containing protein [Halobacteriovorax sp. Y22]